jgi:hypothetical protein
MPTKISLALGPRRPLSRQMAWGCMTTNLAVPGIGSLMAGRVTGYIQLLLTVGGMILTLWFGVRFIVWAVGNWNQLQQADDPVAPLLEMWNRAHWALLGIGIFALAWLWALTTSVGIVREARAGEFLPPRSPGP